MSKVDEAFELISGMTILEARDLVKKIEDEFGVTAAAPVAAVAVAPARPMRVRRRRSRSSSRSR